MAKMQNAIGFTKCEKPEKSINFHNSFDSIYSNNLNSEIGHVLRINWRSTIFRFSLFEKKKKKRIVFDHHLNEKWHAKCIRYEWYKFHIIYVRIILQNYRLIISCSTWERLMFYVCINKRMNELQKVFACTSLDTLHIVKHMQLWICIYMRHACMQCGCGMWNVNCKAETWKTLVHKSYLVKWSQNEMRAKRTSNAFIMMNADEYTLHTLTHTNIKHTRICDTICHPSLLVRKKENLT